VRNTIGIVGQGFVGSAVREGMKHAFKIESFDTDPEKTSSCSNIPELVDCIDEVVFVCLPTPMRPTGQCDTRLVESVVGDINDAACRLNKKIIAVVKSTVEPGTTARLDAQCAHISVVFNPEFLTEANSFDDFKNQSRIIIGGARPASTKVKTVFRKAFPKTTIVKTSPKIAEMVKYFTNCFLATKVSFANEMKQVCDIAGVDFDKVVEYALYDDRLGKSHLSVPGPDGSPGFGGHCFPKDLNAILHFANKHGVRTPVLSGVWQKNIEVREPSARDWEYMLGRAVTID